MTAKPLTFQVVLPPELARFVRERVDSGLYASVSEVVREALRAFAEPQEAAIDRDPARAGIAALRRMRRGTNLGPGITSRDLIDDGRA